ncbi:MAG: branched-chain amino acid ABC transporter permease [Candidatus Rokuibacteriota bacterium]
MGRVSAGAGLLLLALVPALPLGPAGDYLLHVLIQILIWAFVGTAWSLMGRFGLTSLGHGAFLGIGAYGTTLLWNFWGVSPWVGVFVSVAGAAAIALVLGYPCFRFRVVGHYFALVTLALGEVVRLVITAERNVTGGSLGMTLRRAGGDSLVALQYADKAVWYYASLGVWAGGLLVWARLQRSMTRLAMEAIGEDETAAASVGIRVTRFKLKITLLSAGLTAVGGILYAQYITYLNPETLSGVGVSLRIVFASIVGGMYSLLGPTVGTALTTALAEYLRVAFGVRLIGMAETIYGLLLILFIIFLPEGIWGGLARLVSRRRESGVPPVTAVAPPTR